MMLMELPRLCKVDSDCSVGQTCRQYGVANTGVGVQDTCGEISATNDPVWADFQSITATCTDVDDNGYLDLPYCMSWKVSGAGNILCLSPLATSPTNGAKCRCDDGFDIPIYVPPPPDLLIDKTAPENAVPGTEIEFGIEVQNVATEAVAPNVVLTDDLESDFDFVSITTNDPNVDVSKCTIDGVLVGDVTHPDGNYGDVVVCPLRDMEPVTGGVIDTIELILTVKVHPDSQGDVPNTACVTNSADPSEPDPDLNNNCDTTTTTTPVTISYFQVAEQSNGTLKFEWTTSTETGNVGFNLYAMVDGSRVQLNDTLLPSSVLDSVEPVQYAYDTGYVDASEFYIEDVDMFGRKQSHGPFSIGEAYGSNELPETIDWTAVQAESAAKSEVRVANTAALVNESLAETIVQDNFILEATDHLYLPSISSNSNVMVSTAGNKKSSAKVSTIGNSPATAAGINILVSTTGIQRVTNDQLISAGLDLSGSAAASISLTNRGEPVPIVIGGGAKKFGAGSYIEFYGEALDTLYTDTNVYMLTVDRSTAKRVPNVQEVPTSSSTEPYYMATLTRNLQKQYSFTAPQGDPWTEVFLDANDGQSGNTR